MLEYGRASDARLSFAPCYPRIRLLPAVFLDRDGVLNRDSPEFIKMADEFELLPGVCEAVARLNRAGYVAVVITNQSGIPRGLVTVDDLEAMHAKLLEAMEAADAQVAGIYYCSHLPEDGCECRKPKPGMVLQAASEHRIDLSNSWLIGDKPDDITCGHAAGCRTILVLTGQTRDFDAPRSLPAPDHICTDLSAAVELILSQDRA